MPRHLGARRLALSPFVGHAAAVAFWVLRSASQAAHSSSFGVCMRHSNAQRRIGLHDKVVPLLLETHGPNVSRVPPPRAEQDRAGRELVGSGASNRRLERGRCQMPSAVASVGYLWRFGATEPPPESIRQPRWT